MNQITLSENVMVSDPCYSLDTWCQTKLNNVLPGIYNVQVEKSDEDVLGDCCGVCGGEVEEDGTCSYCDEEEEYIIPDTEDETVEPIKN